MASVSCSPGVLEANPGLLAVNTDSSFKQIGGGVVSENFSLQSANHAEVLKFYACTIMTRYIKREENYLQPTRFGDTIIISPFLLGSFPKQFRSVLKEKVNTESADCKPVQGTRRATWRSWHSLLFWRSIKGCR